MFNIEKTGSEQTFGLQPFQVLLSLKPWKFSTKFLLGSFFLINLQRLQLHLADIYGTKYSRMD